MALDAVMLAALVNEIGQQADGAAVDKVQQPAADEIVLTLRGRAGGGKLVISLSPAFPGIYFTRLKRENPAQPPMFCMLLRKHLQGAKLIGIEQTPGERIVILRFSCLSELGDRVERQLIIELMGRRTNLILAQEDGLMIDCLKRVTPDDPAGRRLLPGLRYEAPRPMEREFFVLMDDSAIRESLEGRLEDGPVIKVLTRMLAGLSPLAARQICALAGVDEDNCSSGDEEALIEQCIKLRNRVLTGRIEPVLVSEDRVPQDMCYIPITCFGTVRQSESFDTFSDLFDAWYERKTAAELMRRKSKEVRKLVSSAHEREIRKLNARINELEQCADRDELRRNGELIISNIYLMEKGQTSVTAPDYSLPDAPNRTVKLDPLKTPQQNAAAYFKEYRKAGTAIEHLTELISAGKEQRDYLGSVLDEIDRASSAAELEEIRTELEQSGVLRAKKGDKKKKNTPLSKPVVYISNSGYEIFVGKNNRQNDELTFRTARKDDLWLHIKDFHGSHVIIRCAGAQPDDDTINYAANLAVTHSQSDGRAAVDMARVKFVKKTPGAKPGMVIYTNYTTVMGEPLHQLR